MLTNTVKLNGNKRITLDVPPSDKYITIYNNTSYIVNIIRGERADDNDLIFSIPIYTGLSFPLPDGVSKITLAFYGTGEASALVTLTPSNPGVTQNFITPEGTQTVAFASGEKTASGNLKCAVLEGEVEIKNDMNNPVPVNSSSIEAKLDQIITLLSGTIDVVVTNTPLPTTTA